MLVKADLGGAAPIFVGPVAGHRDHDGLLELTLLPQSLRHVVTVKLRQPDVKEDDLRPLGLGDVEGRKAVVGHPDHVAVCH